LRGDVGTPALGCPILAQARAPTLHPRPSPQIISHALKEKGMKLTVNGEAREVAARTVLGLLEELGLQPARTVVEQNAVIVSREVYGDTLLKDGDVLELVRLVGGG